MNESSDCVGRRERDEHEGLFGAGPGRLPLGRGAHREVDERQQADQQAGNVTNVAGRRTQLAQPRDESHAPVLPPGSRGPPPWAGHCPTG